MTPRRPRLKSSDAPRSDCPVACSLDLLGDRWTLLVVRDLLMGMSRYGEFVTSAEGIPTNILADRLERLQSSGVIRRAAYQNNPPRFAYSLTKKGKALRPVLAALATWAMDYLPGTQPSERTLAALKSQK